MLHCIPLKEDAPEVVFFCRHNDIAVASGWGSACGARSTDVPHTRDLHGGVQ